VGEVILAAIIMIYMCRIAAGSEREKARALRIKNLVPRPGDLFSDRRKTPRVPFRVPVHVEVIKSAPHLH
jgi:hypothetical protein